MKPFPSILQGPWERDGKAARSSDKPWLSHSRACGNLLFLWIPPSEQGRWEHSLVCCSFVCLPAYLGAATDMAYCAELCESQALGSLGSYLTLTEPAEFV